MENQTDKVINQTEAEQLKPCPFCGSSEIERIGWGYYAPAKRYRRECKECKATTALQDSPELADRAWNTRTSQAEQLEKAVEAEREAIIEMLTNGDYCRYVEHAQDQCSCEDIAADIRARPLLSEIGEKQ